ncbi:MAG: 3-deoxy-7-phosphoheptulonate synthase [Proteobacteria bacterium]|nr:3-deoxy-7-phosphoheptulonate synthase [Pseudomonadota bacterium]
MIIVLKPDASEEQIRHMVEKVKGLGLSVHLSKGAERSIIGAIGDEALLTSIPLETFPGVEKVMPILKPYKLVSREFQQENTVIDVKGVKIGGNEIQVIAGPCSIENAKNVLEVAMEVKKSGATILRGGAFKPRTSPYDFQGLGAEGLEYLKAAGKEAQLPVITEIMDPRDLELICENADIIQVGARNMQNFMLLKEIGKTDKPVLLKRGLCATIKEFLMSAEYIASQGNRKIILCERGIRTYDTETRNTLDLSAVPVIKSLSHLPVVVDPSHAVGKWSLVAAMSKAAIAAGADGLMIEVHANPEEALCDGAQSLKPRKFDLLMKELKRIANAVDRDI